MICDSCGSERILSLTAKCRDSSWGNYQGQEWNGYPPTVEHISAEDDFVRFATCLECGKIQGEFPVENPPELRRFECSECGEGPHPSELRYVNAGDPCIYRDGMLDSCPGVLLEVRE